MAYKIKITAGGIYGAEGKELQIGDILTLDAEPTGWAGRYEVIGETDGKAAVTNPAKGAKGKGKADDKPAFATEERDSKWFVVDSEGNAQGAELTAEDAKTFTDLSDEDKAEFVAAHVKG